ncbi:MAG: NUDIX domain-containing protein [Oscillospiraceae bacterium]|nr:NUDIX domain-containing protein [Oscillospiraceae bacterium]
MTQMKFYSQCPAKEENIQFAVVCARYQNRWILCRHKQRSTWEIPGGHREIGEPIDETARRELWEETGVADANIHRIGSYSVEQNGELTYGMLYFADVHTLGEVPMNSEIGKTAQFEILPKDLTYPDIQPQLHRWIQGWLNLQSGAGEMWDVIDKDRNPTGRLHRRGDFLPPGEYHLVVHVWMRNSQGQYLMTKRSPNKGFPNMWETTGGSALAGDDSLTAALREVREETGLQLDPAKGEMLFSITEDEDICDIWLFHQDFDLSDVVLLEGETCDVKYASKDQILQMRQDGAMVHYSYLDDLLAL